MNPIANFGFVLIDALRTFLTENKLLFIRRKACAFSFHNGVNYCTPPLRFTKKFLLYSLVLLCLQLAICNTSVAQDPHFSQFYSSPLTLNPAMTGLFAGDGRLTATYRTQWQAVSAPFTTGTVSFDARILRGVFQEKDVFGLGGMALYDQSNNGGLKAKHISICAGFNKQLDENGYNRLGVGFQAIFTSKTVDYSKFVFSRQFTPNGFDNALPTGEPRAALNLNYPDMGVGLLYSGMNDAEQQWYLGASCYHITSPNESVTNQSNPLQPRATIHTGYNYPVGEMSRMYFSGMYMHSAITEEFMLGSVFQANVGVYEKESSVLLGVFHRFKDSFIPYFGLQVDNFQTGLSYDINTSSLKSATQGRGGFELSLQYLFVADPNLNAIPKCYNRF